jgi:branched-chain amino acid aminotransferase
VSGVASIDGRLHALEGAAVPVTDRGFLYSDAVFEALRTYGGEPDALAQHLARLARSCATLGIVLPVGLDQLADEVRAAVAAVAAPERYVRIMITRGDWPAALAPGLPTQVQSTRQVSGGPLPAASGTSASASGPAQAPPAAPPPDAGAARARRVILVRPLLPTPASVYDVGVRAQTVVAPPWALTAGAKPSAYLTNLLALAAAQRAGADDALLLGACGELLEGATSSLFLVRDGELFTPPLALGILPGITRDRIFAVAQRLGLAPREKLLFVHDAYRADELFLTSSVRQVVGLVALDGLSIGDHRPGPVTRRVAAAYGAEVGLDPTGSAG